MQLCYLPQCTVDISYDIQDTNTATPVATPETYTTTLREDFPPYYAIPGVEVSNVRQCRC